MKTVANRPIVFTVSVTKAASPYEGCLELALNRDGGKTQSTLFDQSGIGKRRSGVEEVLEGRVAKVKELRRRRRNVSSECS